MMGLSTILRVLVGLATSLAVTYTTFLAILTIPYFQDQAIYLHKVKLTWGQDINEPEIWGFLKNQVKPFAISTPDGEVLHAWHILPTDVYRRHETELQRQPSGFTRDITSTLNFKLLRDDPESLLVIYLHGAAGTLGSGFRPPSYRAISAGAPRRIHIVAIDYRGFGLSTGWPSESGLLTDAQTLTTWATTVAAIPPSRIVIFGQSIGTAVGLSLTSSLALDDAHTLFSGIVLVAPFANVETLTATYRIAGTIPLLSPLARFPTLFKALNNFIVDKWPSNERIAALVRFHESSKNIQAKYDITIIHAEDDYDIHYSHSEQLFWSAVNATNSANHGLGISIEELEQIKQERGVSLEAGGRFVEWTTPRGTVREEILKHGLHDRIMSYPIVTRAVLRAFANMNEID